MKSLKIFPTLLLCLYSAALTAAVRLPTVYSSGMVLQRDTEIRIHGWAAAGERVAVTFRNHLVRTVADKNGDWSVSLPPAPAGGPFEMVVKGTNTLRLNNILIGDVWFCSGQSNMVLPLDRVRELYPEVLGSNGIPQIRNFTVPVSSDVTGPHPELPAVAWKEATKDNLPEIGAVAWFFAKSLYDRYQVPIGIINSSVGGTPIRAWISGQGLEAFPEFAERMKRFGDTAWLRRQLQPAPKLSGEINGMVPDAVYGTDAGLQGPLPWSDPAYAADDWERFWLPGYWNDQGVSNLHGVVWFRKDIRIPETMAGKAAKLYMGRIVDADQVFVNGVQVGAVTYQYPPRRYTVPEGLLKSGSNTIVVRVTNYAGKGGFVPDKPYFMKAGTDSIDLRGDWRYKVGAVYRPAPSTISTLVQQNEPAGLFNTMVAPLAGFPVKGFVWYQGETDAGHPSGYGALLQALIRDWRTQWNQGELPFLIVQLAGFMEDSYLPVESQWAEIRQAQLEALAMPQTAMAVALDAGEWNDVHPLHKKVVGERLSLLARKLAYGEDHLIFSGPLPLEAAMEDGRVICSFMHTGSGLIARNDTLLQGFAVAGADRCFVWARARIEEDQVVVTSDEVEDPVYVRYAWADNPERANLYNREGLPASPFELKIVK